MGPFEIGLAAGGFGGLAVAGVVAAVAYRRSDRRRGHAHRAQRQAELGTLTGGLAHEIKNPLSTIQLNLQLLGEDLSPRDLGPKIYARLANRLATVQRETGRLGDILDDFRRYAGRIELEKRPVDLRRVFDELADFVAPQAQIQRVRVRVAKCEADGELPPTVPLDDRLIKQALLNLVINALQAMPERGGEVVLSACRDGNRAAIAVADTGAGIPAEQVDHIFDAYYSTKKNGTGLGLAITKRIAEEHGGRIRVRSEVGKGSTFTIEVPIR